jgi:hypothetical protein
MLLTIYLSTLVANFSTAIYGLIPLQLKGLMAGDRTSRCHSVISYPYFGSLIQNFEV